MDGIQGVIVLILYVGLGIWLCRREPEQPDDETEAPFFDSIRLEQEVEQLHKKMKKLREFDEMIIDLRLCRPDAVQRAFRMEWQSAAGIDHTLDMIADGENPSTRYFLQLARAEREALNAEIQTRIFDLYCRACVEDMAAEFSDEKKLTV